MNATSGSTRLRRFSLLIGMLLHLLGAAAIPAFHASEAAFDPSHGAALTHQQGDGGEPGAPHSDLDCVLCQASGALAVPADGAQLPLVDAPRRAETPAARPALPFRPASPAQARAPPLV
jgi:Protein of unknown function (DUF2946)